MRPADTRAIPGAIVNGATSASIPGVMPADVSLGRAACAVCTHPEAAPMLAGDQLRGPDYLYLVCDRCGGRWQRHPYLDFAARSREDGLGRAGD